MADVKNSFTQEEVQGIIKQVLDEVIGLSPYNYADSLNWNKQAVEQITKRLVALNRPYKYIVNSSLLQIGNGTGMNVSTISYWNKATDRDDNDRAKCFIDFVCDLHTDLETK